MLFIISWVIIMSCNSTNGNKIPTVITETKEINKSSKKESMTREYHTVDYITGKFLPEERKDFILIPEQFADRTGMYMRRDAFEAFKKMYQDAAEDGIMLKIRSAARNFNYQKSIWENKWMGKRILSDGTNAATDIEDDVERSLKILEYSSMPGSSRHHWGTDIDLNSFDNKWFESGEGLKLYQWMQKHAIEYGYCQVYCNKGNHRSGGYNEEKWHYSFMPESEGLLAFANSNLQLKDIAGFLGDHTAGKVDIINTYIMGIDQRCHKHTD